MISREIHLSLAGLYPTLQILKIPRLTKQKAHSKRKRKYYHQPSNPLAMAGSEYYWALWIGA